MQDNTLDHLADTLFRQLDKISNQPVNEDDIKQTKSMIDVSKEIVSIRKLQLDVVKVKREMGLQSPELQAKLLPAPKER